MMASTLAIYYIAKGKAFAFYDVGSDTLFCYYPLQLAVARQLQTLHAVTWSFSMSIGGFLGTLFDPLWLITGWLPDSWQLSLRLPMFLFRLVLAGALFQAYLRQIGFLAPVAIIGGLGYAFSSYGLINAQWDVAHATEFIQFAAYLYLLERYLASPAKWAAIVAGIVLGIGHPVALYMFALLSLVYGPVRLLMTARAQRASTARSMMGFAAWSLPGLALAAPLLFPALYYLLESPRVSEGFSSPHAILDAIFSLNDRLVIGSEIAGLLGKDLLGTGSRYAGWSNYFEGPGFYVGLLPLLCIPQLFGPRASRRERILLLCGVIACVLYFTFPALRNVVYGFGLGHSAFRFSTDWLSALLLVMGLAGLQRGLLSGWWRAGAVGGAATILLIALSATILTPDTVNVPHVIRVIAFATLYLGVILLSADADTRPRGAAYLLAAICACELLVFAIPPVLERDAVNADGSSAAGRYDDGTEQALAFIAQRESGTEFFRIEKTFTSVFLDDALAQGYPGTASYYFNAASVTRFVDHMNLPRPVPYSNYIGAMTGRPKVLDLLGVRYVLTRHRSLDGAASMTYLASVGGVDVYRNDAARGFASFYDSMVPESEADGLPVPGRDELLLASAVVGNPGELTARLAALSFGPPASPVARNTHIELIRDDQLQGEVETPSASLLLLSMPFDRGWSAWLGSKNLDLFRADYGLTAALIPPGHHTISLAYEPPGRTLGIAVMAGAATFIVILALFSPDARRRPPQSRFRFLEAVSTRLRARFGGARDRKT
jgi:hypothetical protein